MTDDETKSILEMKIIEAISLISYAMVFGSAMLYLLSLYIQ